MLHDPFIVLLLRPLVGHLVISVRAIHLQGHHVVIMVLDPQGLVEQRAQASWVPKLELSLYRGLTCKTFSDVPVHLLVCSGHNHGMRALQLGGGNQHLVREHVDHALK